MKSDILEITDNPQEYFITQEKPVSIVSNLTSSLKKLDSSTEPKKSVTFRHDLITGKTFLLTFTFGIFFFFYPEPDFMQSGTYWMCLFFFFK